MHPISLYKASGALIQLLDQIDDDGVISEELSVAMATFDGKGANVVGYILNCETHVKMIHEAAANMAKRAIPLEKRAESLRRYLADNMKRTGVDEITTPEFTAKLYRERDSRVDVFDEKQIPEEFMRLPEPKPPVAVADKKKISDALKLGNDVPGARIVKSDRLTIV